jgi:hypothetical protein
MPLSEERDIFFSTLASLSHLGERKARQLAYDPALAARQM